MGLFGSSKNYIWESLASQIGANYQSDFWKGSKLTAKIGEWTVVLDTHKVSTGKSTVTYTRIRAPYVNQNGFRFTIYKKSIFSDLGKLFGMRDIEIGYDEFDDSFIIKSNDEDKVRSLFSNEKLRQMIQHQPNFHLTVKDDEGFFGNHFPEGVDELYFAVRGVINNIDRLKNLFDIFAETLNQLCIIGAAYKDDPKVELK